MQSIFYDFVRILIKKMLIIDTVIAQCCFWKIISEVNKIAFEVIKPLLSIHIFFYWFWVEMLVLMITLHWIEDRACIKVHFLNGLSNNFVCLFQIFIIFSWSTFYIFSSVISMLSKRILILDKIGFKVFQCNNYN